MRKAAIELLKKHQKEDKEQLATIVVLFVAQRNFCSFDELEEEKKEGTEVLKDW